MALTRMPIDPDAGIPDLIHRLSDDSKRLVKDEVRLAKLEIRENLDRGGRGTMLLVVAFGIGVVALVAFTLFVATLVGRVASGHMWVGAVVTGVVELAVAAVLIKRGRGTFAEPSYSLEQTRESLSDTKDWVTSPR